MMKILADENIPMALPDHKARLVVPALASRYGWAVNFSVIEIKKNRKITLLHRRREYQGRMVGLERHPLACETTG